jgi:hypothetical protein
MGGTTLFYLSGNVFVPNDIDVKALKETFIDIEQQELVTIEFNAQETPDEKESSSTSSSGSSSSS